MNLEIVEKDPKLSIGEYVYDTIKENIINWNIKPGVQMSENEISEYLNVSRTPVREAFIKLSREKILEIIPQKGSYIAYVDLDIIDDVWFLRKNVESAILIAASKQMTDEDYIKLKSIIELQKLAVDKEEYRKFLSYDDEFHHYMYCSVGRERVWTLIHSFDTQYIRLRMLTLLEYIDSNRIMEEHLQLINVIKNGSEKEIIELTSQHIDKLNKDLTGIAQKYPHYFKK